MKLPARILILCVALLPACSNNPYPAGVTDDPTYFRAFMTEPTKLDPARAYYVHEGQIIDQIYEPPFTYHYLKRPYELIPLTATAVPTPVFFDKNGRPLERDKADTTPIGRVEYTIHIKPGILYQDHPCFARDDKGRLIYRNVQPKTVRHYRQIHAFPHRGTRELKARDYALQIRRLADPRLNSPIFSVMAGYIDGMAELRTAYTTLLEKERIRRKAEAGASYVQEIDEKRRPIRLDYMKPEFPGIKVIDDHTYRITLKKPYPQILYWMCMHFFGPMPQEALDFYTEPAIVAQQFVINRWPVGTGPYYLHTFKPEEKIILERNPNYHEDTYPSEGAPGDREAGLLVDAGKPLPFIHRQFLRFEREVFPAWNKFVQGYYDGSGIGNDVFDQAVQFRPDASTALSEDMQTKGISLITDVETTFYYVGFNMLDPVIGGYSEKQCKLRQAISIAMDYNDFLEIFMNGRGILAQGPLPPGIFGYREGKEGTNPYVDAWDPVRKRHIRKPIEVARRLMAEAGYPEGIGPDGKPLVLHFDHAGAGEADLRSRFLWMRKRLDLLGIRLEDRGTDLSRFREKRIKGNWQLSMSGWLADYPDPENFLFLFYGPNGKVKTGGPNAVNYSNPSFDALFEKLESMDNTPQRQKLIDEAMDLVRHDAPSVWMFHPKAYILRHAWYHNVKPHNMSYNTMKYRRIDPALRATSQRQWNHPVMWPVYALIFLVAALVLPAVIGMYRRERGL
jgi:ABC-type transport system substrate-binding protein